MTNPEYHDFVLRCRIPALDQKLYLATALGGEAGEVLNEVKKEFRADVLGTPQDRTEHVKDELGDMLHYAVSLADRYGITLEDIMIYNVQKLTARYGGKLPGSKPSDKE